MARDVDRRSVLKGITLGAFGLGSVVAVGDLLEISRAKEPAKAPVKE